MKKLYLILLSVFALLNTVLAQELKVKSFRLAINDLTASTDVVPDKNGDPCALVKILVVDSIAKLEGFVLKTKKSSLTELWAYMSNGAKEIRIKPTHYKPLYVYLPNFGINGVEGKRTYILDIEPVKSIVEVNGLSSQDYSLIEMMKKIKVASEKEDWTTIEKMAEEGISLAFYPLAKHCLEIKNYQLADTYAQKSCQVQVNVDKAKMILKYLQQMGFYDDKEFPKYIK